MIAITTHIRLATTHDLLYGPGLLKIGEPYFIKHPTKQTISGPYIIDKYHSSTKLKEYYKTKCIYVPVIDFDFDIANNLQQKDFKKQNKAQ